MSNVSNTRIDRRFAELKAADRKGLVTYLMANDPDYQTSLAIIKALPGAGADVIEVGMPFSDPMAEGPTIQAAAQRSLKSGGSLRRTLALVREFRKDDDTTPLVLMGYYNPIYRYGPENFVHDALEAGADGVIVVDLPPEEDEELCLPALRAGLNFIRLATPTSDEKRLPALLANTSGFIYYVSITGITGAAAPDTDTVRAEVARMRPFTDLPIAVGFGIRSADQAAEIAAGADAVVVGSALVSLVGNATSPEVARDSVLGLVRELAEGVRRA